MKRLVIDTDVFVSALRSADGAARAVIRRCLEGQFEPCMSLALFAEYQDVMARDHLFVKSPLAPDERLELFYAFISVCVLTEIYYLWRPNLRDEGDNHLLELAVAASAEAIVTRNRRDFVDSELRFPGVRILGPAELLKEN